MRNQSLARSTIRGTLWTYASLYGSKLINLVTVAVLARLLLKEDFGVAAYATVIVTFMDFPGLGIGPALIYHDKDPNRTNTGFWLAILIGAMMFVAAWMLAPLAGAFFRDPRAIPVNRLLALYFPLVSLAVVPGALLDKNLSFKRKFLPEMAGSLSKGIVSITAAWMGYGAWSILFGFLANQLATTISLWIAWPSDWRPSLRFDPHLARPLLTYGLNIISVYLLGILLLNVDYLLVGRYLGAAALGVYTLAFRIPELMIKSFYAAVSQVLFPVYTKIKDDPAALNRGFITAMRYTMLLTVPMSLGLSLISRPLIMTFFGEKWIEAVPVMSAIALYTLLRSLYFTAGSVFKAQGRPDILSRLHLLNIAVLIPTLWLAVTYYRSIIAVGWAQVIVVLLVGILRLGVVGHILKTPMRVMLSALYPVAVSAVVMALAVLAVLRLTANAIPPVQLAASIVAGAIVYSVVVWLFHKDIVIKAGQTLRSAIARG